MGVVFRVGILGEKLTNKKDKKKASFECLRYVRYVRRVLV